MKRDSEPNSLLHPQGGGLPTPPHHDLRDSAIVLAIVLASGAALALWAYLGGAL